MIKFVVVEKVTKSSLKQFNTIIRRHRFLNKQNWVFNPPAVHYEWSLIGYGMGRRQ